MTAVGFLYRYGYFTQTLSVDGQQIANYEPQNFNQLPIEQVVDENGNPVILEVPYPGRVIYSHIWKVNVGRMNLYLMDTDFDMNSEFDRQITHQLYGGDWENRIKQEYMLGIGGILMLKSLASKPTSTTATKAMPHCSTFSVLSTMFRRTSSTSTLLLKSYAHQASTLYTPPFPPDTTTSTKASSANIWVNSRKTRHKLGRPHEHGSRES